MEDGEDAERAADPGAIVGERLDGGRRFAEEEGIDRFLMRSRQRAEFAGERQGEQVVIARGQASAEPREPRLGHAWARVS